MGLGGVAIATLPSVICAKLMFSDGLGGGFVIIFAITKPLFVTPCGVWRSPASKCGSRAG